VEHVLVRQMYVPDEILQSGCLAKVDELVVDEVILDVVELVDVLHNCLTLILDNVLDKRISAYGNTKSNVVNHK
jgi:cephalosporin-C deacetylase-like acetyl esterase